MKYERLLNIALMASLLAPGLSSADPFDPKRVPADCKWVLHADLDAARDSKTYDSVCDKILSNGDAQAKFAQIQQLTGMKMPDDLHDFTVYGKEAGDEAGVILVHGKIDRNKTVSSLHFADQFASNPYSTYQVMTWLDKDKNQTMFGAFHDDTNVVISRNEKNIQLALDAMDGKSETIKPGSPLVAGAKPQLLLYVAAQDVPQLHEPGKKSNPVLESVQTVWISLSEKDDMVHLNAELQGASADTATDIRQSLDGLRGMLSLAGRGDNPDPTAKAIVTAARSFTATQKDKSVIVDWPIPVEQIQTIIDSIAEKSGIKH